MFLFSEVSLRESLMPNTVYPSIMISSVLSFFDHSAVIQFQNWNFCRKTFLETKLIEHSWFVVGDHVPELDGENVFRSGEQHCGSGESQGVF